LAAGQEGAKPPSHAPQGIRDILTRGLHLHITFRKS